MGVTSFKLFMTYKKRPKRMVSDEFIAKTMERLAALGGLCQLHCENGDVLCYLEDKAIAAGPDGAHRFPGRPARTGRRRRRSTAPSSSAGSPTARCTSCISRPGSASSASSARRREGQKVWTETCPQYLLLTDKEMERLGPFAKIGPPLRPADGPDRAALWAGSRRASSPRWRAITRRACPPRRSRAGRTSSSMPTASRFPFGAPSLETLVPLMYSEGVVKRGLPMTWMARVLAENPARIFGLYPRKGVIRVGADADLRIWDRRPTWTIERGAASRHRRLHALRGLEGARQAVDDAAARPGLAEREGVLEQKPGYGRYLAAHGPAAADRGRRGVGAAR